MATKSLETQLADAESRGLVATAEEIRRQIARRKTRTRRSGPRDERS